MCIDEVKTAGMKNKQMLIKIFSEQQVYGSNWYY